MSTYAQKQIKKQTLNKLNIVAEIKQLTKEYYILIDELSSIFISSKEQKELEAEIKLIEQTLKSKLIISSSMRGF